MTGGTDPEDEIVLRGLLALVETELAIVEHGHDPLSDDPDAAAVGDRLRARMAARAAFARTDLDLDVELWLLLEGSAQYAARQGVSPGPLRATDPESGALIVVRAGAEAGSWSVSLSKVAAGRYRVALAHGTDVLGEVEVEARAGTTVRASIRFAGAGPDRVRVWRIADGT
ncbi:hypothetical protein [uncultured Pseudonocardia sp.]|uniref:hypothetical protein n=1 Tax=uncultured Pseudonocardia sp. TaxID=211455 RepID=UPI0026242811|nr:hypothetical protein [uncultured Pseudonocardia sp.]